MDNLRAVIKNLFCYMSSDEILEGNVVYNKITVDVFKQLGAGYITSIPTMKCPICITTLKVNLNGRTGS